MVFETKYWFLILLVLPLFTSTLYASDLKECIKAVESAHRFRDITDSDQVLKDYDNPAKPNKLKDRISTLALKYVTRTGAMFQWSFRESKKSKKLINSPEQIKNKKLTEQAITVCSHVDELKSVIEAEKEKLIRAYAWDRECSKKIDVIFKSDEIVLSGEIYRYPCMASELKARDQMKNFIHQPNKNQNCSHCPK